MIKKVSKILALVMGVSFVLFILCLPFGIRATIKDLNRIMNEVMISPTKVMIDPLADTLSFEMNYYGNVEFMQSPNDEAFIEYFNGQTLNRGMKIGVSYIDATKAVLSYERIYGDYKLDRDTIEKSIVKEFQNYPDAIIYIPERMRIESENFNFWSSEWLGISFLNKSEFIEKRNQEEEKNTQQEQGIESVQTTDEVY